MDLHEVYQFVNFFPFLIDSEKMNEILRQQSIDDKSYELNIIDNKEFDSNFYQEDTINEEQDDQSMSQSNSDKNDNYQN